MAMEASPEAMVMVVDKERYAEELRKWLECPICCDALFQPVHMGCEHLLCRGCVTQLDFYHKGKGLPPCPVCKQVPESTKLYPNSTNHMGLASICPMPDEYREPCRRCGLGNMTPAETMVHSIECTHRSVACEYGDKCRYTYEPLDVNSQHMYLNHIVKVHKGHISKAHKAAMELQGGRKRKGHPLMVPRQLEAAAAAAPTVKGDVLHQAMGIGITKDNRVEIGVDVQLQIDKKLMFWRKARRNAFMAAHIIMDKRMAAFHREPSTQQKMSDALRDDEIIKKAMQAASKASPEVRGKLMCSGLVTTEEAELMCIVAKRKAQQWAQIHRAEERMQAQRERDPKRKVPGHKRYTKEETDTYKQSLKRKRDEIKEAVIAKAQSREHMDLDLPELELGTRKEWHKAIGIAMPVEPDKRTRKLLTGEIVPKKRRQCNGMRELDQRKRDVATLTKYTTELNAMHDDT